MLTPVHQDWVYPTNATVNAWPSGSASGDVVILILFPARLGIQFWSTFLENPPRGWFKAGTLFDSLAGPFGYNAHVFWTVRGSAAPSIDLRLGFARMIAVPGAFGVGTVRNGVRRATVKANGGVIVISEIGPDSSPATDFAGTTLLSGQMNVVVGGNTWLRSRVGWASSATAALIGVTDESVFAASDDALTLEILPPKAPLPPVIVTPAPGQEISDSGGASFAWAHSPVLSGGTQSAYRLRVKAVSSGTWQWWNATTSALTGSETSNTSAAGALTLSSALFTSLTQYEVQVATQEAIDGQWSAYSASTTFTPVPAPSVAITSSGSWSGDLTPTITWTPTTPRGSQIAWRVTVVAGSTLHDSGWQTGSNTSYTLPVLDWVNGGTNTLSVWVRQTGGSESPAATQSLTVSWTPPATPVVTPTVSGPAPDALDGFVPVPGEPGYYTLGESSLGAGPAGIELDIAVAGAPGGLLIDIERQVTSDPDGVWVPVMTGILYPASGSLVTWDVLAPYGQAVIYRARASQIVDGVPLRSAWGTSDAVTSTDRQAYVVSDVDRSDWLRVRIVDDGEIAMHQDIAVNYGRGDDTPFVDYSPPQGFSGTMTLSTPSEQDTIQLREWLLSDRNMLLRLPPYAGVNVEPRRFARTSLSESHLDQSTTIDIRHTTFDWVSQ